jgi:hypothetical protein
VVAIKIRAAKGSGSTPGAIAMGVKTGGSIYVDASPDQLAQAWETHEHYLEENPDTSNPWTTSEIDSLQMNLQSALNIEALDPEDVESESDVADVTVATV